MMNSRRCFGIGLFGHGWNNGRRLSLGPAGCFSAAAVPVKRGRVRSGCECWFPPIRRRDRSRLLARLMRRCARLWWRGRLAFWPYRPPMSVLNFSQADSYWFGRMVRKRAYLPRPLPKHCADHNSTRPGVTSWRSGNMPMPLGTCCNLVCAWVCIPNK